MSVVDDIQSRIAAISQLFPALATASAQSAQLIDSTSRTFGSEFESAMAAMASNDVPSDPIGSAQAATQSMATGDVVTGQTVVSDARRYLGVPYLYGGTDPSKGLDCSALVQRAYADLGISLPRTSQQQATMGTAVPSLAQAKPGDLVCFGDPATHIGIYAGNGSMIVAPHTGTTVQIQRITQTPSTIRRIIPDTAGVNDGFAPNAVAFVARPAALSSTSALSTTSGATAGAPYAAQFAAAERHYGLPSGLLSAVAHAESNYRPDAVSTAGAVGLMQLMPATAQAFGVDPTDPAQSIDGAARLLKGELDKYGSIPLALASYNAGGPTVDKFGGIPPYPETRNYVKKVMTYMSEAA